ncbi:LysM peptidoglycan-binding domain-containing protein [Granulosicoccus antarcticus]|uniref:LysM domain-containing protein n=1 Tax=Granulosicoccus antarcticus IMCC3135 TaxID=1192854 RepID=A0A2Z2P4S0_9GAMM|nr:LysM peptidoglycan-binding domain-containing protein [Granulosicoccus antarcticus]ASJ76460.1 hypothetical protein IMCC3135_32070 [Granulosicoccus antarcticus IMCC3135]
MKNYASLSVAMCLSVALAAGCATSGINSNQAPDNQTSAARLSIDDVQHTVAPGDRLSDIALKYTGRVDQWETIATYNKITDPRTLRIGDIITIPASMLREKRTESSNKNTGRETLSNNPAGVATTTGTLALQRAREVKSTNSEAPDVHIASVNTNRTFELNPIESSNLATSQRYGTKPPQVRVIGTYYPKGVYQQPASYSKLMMRVAPGTIFELDQVINEWYKVNTDQGIGYIRAEDGNLMSD